MGKVTGIGGVFLRANDPEALYQWYEKHLALSLQSGCFIFPAGAQRAYAVAAFFKTDDEYFPTKQKAMLNLQVDRLDELLDALAAAGVEVDERRESYDYGKFGWCTDLEGNRIELWEPATETT